MNYSNFIVFEILKFKIEFLDSLEYSLPTYTINKKEIKRNYIYLKNNFTNGQYKEILSSLFTSYNEINKALIIFFKNYNPSKISKMASSKHIDKKVNFNKYLIDSYENFNNILNAFIFEQEIKEKLDPQILELNEISNKHFIHFLFFNLYNLYLNHNNSNSLYKFKDKDIKEIVSLFKYCNKNQLFSFSLNILEKDNEENLHKELERLSNKCIELEKKQNEILNRIINKLNLALQENNSIS